MKSINISLPDAMRTYVEEQVANGSYSTVSEYFRELVRQDRERKAQKHLEALLLEGLASGKESPMTAEDWQEIRQAVRERTTKRQSSSED